MTSDSKTTSSQLISKKEAIALLGLEAKTFNNYFQQAQEFHAEPRKNGRGIYKFNKGPPPQAAGYYCKDITTVSRQAARY